MLPYLMLPLPRRMKLMEVRVAPIFAPVRFLLRSVCSEWEFKRLKAKRYNYQKGVWEYRVVWKPTVYTKSSGTYGMCIGRASRI